MQIFYAGADGVGKADWDRFVARAKPVRLLLGFYDLSIDSRRKWVFKKILRDRRKRK